MEFEKEQDTMRALQYVMGISLHGNVLYIKRSSSLVQTYSVSGSSTTIGNNPNLNFISGSSYGKSFITPDEYNKNKEFNPSKVLCIKNMVSMKELEDDDEYDDLYEDVSEECKSFGKVLSIKIPRPDMNSRQVNGIGKVFVEFANRDGALFAKENLKGKSFHGRFIQVVYHPEDAYKRDQLD